MRFSVFIAVLCCLMPAFVHATEEAQSEAWLKLLHYQKSSGGYVSVVENEAFFLSKNGRGNPIEEYNATVKAFAESENKAKCAFPARFMLLRRLGDVEGALDDCEDYQKFLNDVQPKAVTMLFTNAYMSNPSSLFGHTLFRIDTKRKGTQLLAHGANFGADTGDESGLMYVLKGLWGGYYGTFAIRPYYDVINLYNNIENRDIWEYELNFSDDELVLFMAHLWEMQQAKIRYYFADKNCSYVLLLMLEAVRSELDLSSEFVFYAAPLATLKAVNNVPDFVKATNYRPSRQSKLKHRVEQMSNKQYEAFLKIIKKNEVELDELKEDEKADVLETAYQYVQYQYVEQKLELKDYRKKSFKLLQERSKIKNQKQYFDDLKDGENPVKAHKARQASMIFGARNGDAFQEIGFKPVYNTLLDDSYGLLNGAEINFFDAKLRHYDDTNKWMLSEFDLFTVRSLAGADDMFMPLSYDIKVGYKELFDAKSSEDVRAAVLEAGFGQSYALTKNTLLYVMSVPNAAYGGGLENNGYLGFAFKGGIYGNYGKLRFDLQAMQHFTTSDTARGQSYHAEVAYGISRDVMLYGGYKLFNSDFNDDEEFGFGVKVNF